MRANCGRVSGRNLTESFAVDVGPQGPHPMRSWFWGAAAGGREPPKTPLFFNFFKMRSTCAQITLPHKSQFFSSATKRLTNKFCTFLSNPHVPIMGSFSRGAKLNFALFFKFLLKNSFKNSPCLCPSTHNLQSYVKSCGK